jgi:hypothetical protein
VSDTSIYGEEVASEEFQRKKDGEASKSSDDDAKRGRQKRNAIIEQPLHFFPALVTAVKHRDWKRPVTVTLPLWGVLLIGVFLLAILIIVVLLVAAVLLFLGVLVGKRDCRMRSDLSLCHEL